MPDPLRARVPVRPGVGLPAWKPCAMETGDGALPWMRWKPGGRPCWSRQPCRAHDGGRPSRRHNGRAPRFPPEGSVRPDCARNGARPLRGCASHRAGTRTDSPRRGQRFPSNAAALAAPSAPGNPAAQRCPVAWMPPDQATPAFRFALQHTRRAPVLAMIRFRTRNQSRARETCGKAGRRRLRTGLTMCSVRPDVRGLPPGFVVAGQSSRDAWRRRTRRKNEEDEAVRQLQGFRGRHCSTAIYNFRLLQSPRSVTRVDNGTHEWVSRDLQRMP